MSADAWNIWKQTSHQSSSCKTSLWLSEQGAPGVWQWSRLAPQVSNEASERAVAVLLEAPCLYGAPPFLLARQQIGSVSPAGHTPCQAGCQRHWMQQSLTAVITSCSEDKGDYGCLLPLVYSCDVRLCGYDQLLFWWITPSCPGGLCS